MLFLLHHSRALLREMSAKEPCNICAKELYETPVPQQNRPRGRLHIIILIVVGLFCAKHAQNSPVIYAHFFWWVLQHCTGFARLVWGRLKVHRAFIYSNWFVCSVCFCSLLPRLTLLVSFLDILHCLPRAVWVPLESALLRETCAK